MRRKGQSARTYTLRNAASVVFALTSVIPLLLFVYTLYALDKLNETQALLGLGVALAFSLIGLYIFSTLMGRLAEMLRYLEEQAEEAERRPAFTPPAPGVPATPPAAGAPGPAPPGGPTPFAPRPVPVPPRSPAPAPRGIVVPGLGTVTASHQRPQTPSGFDQIQKSMWKAEAQPHLGRRVAISVRNATEPVVGNLAQISEDGVLLEQGDQKIAVSYLRITSIEPESRPAQS